jgi:hypothetical protein
MKKYTSHSEVSKDYESKKAEKVSIEKPKHVESYDEAQKRSVERSRKNHPAAS